MHTPCTGENGDLIMWQKRNVGYAWMCKVRSEWRKGGTQKFWVDGTRNQPKEFWSLILQASSHPAIRVDVSTVWIPSVQLLYFSLGRSHVTSIYALEWKQLVAFVFAESWTRHNIVWYTPECSECECYFHSSAIVKRFMPGYNVWPTECLSCSQRIVYSQCTIDICKL